MCDVPCLLVVVLLFVVCRLSSSVLVRCLVLVVPCSLFAGRCLLIDVCCLLLVGCC